MSSKLSFRARALDPTKPMPIYFAEELHDLSDYAAINRAVPQMPSGMEKEEESEHHLQRAICTGLIIPTPEVFDVTDCEFYMRNYPPDYKMPKQLIHMQPLAMEQDIPDYDMDSADEQWVNSNADRLDMNPLKFEQMMDRLEKSSGQTVVTLNEAKALLKQDDEISTAVYDYWLSKRLKTQHPLILAVKTENRIGGAANNPYLAFRRRTEKMQTRKNRKNDESSYEKMLKLRRDLSRTVTLLEMIKRREKAKREQLHLTIEIYEKRYQARDFSGQLLAEYSSNAAKQTRPAFAPIYANQYSASSSSAVPSGQGSSGQWQVSSSAHYANSQYHHHHHHHAGSSSMKRERDADLGASGTATGSRKEKRQYKKRKHKIQREKQSHHHHYQPAASIPVSTPVPTIMNVESMLSSDEEEFGGGNVPIAAESDDEGVYSFKRSRTCQYHKPKSGNWPWEDPADDGAGDEKFRFTLTSIRHPRPRCVGFARRRIGRGGRVILDRMATDMDTFWSKLDYTIFDSEGKNSIKSENLTTPLVGHNEPIVSDLIENIKKDNTAFDDPSSILNRNQQQQLLQPTASNVLPITYNRNKSLITNSEQSVIKSEETEHEPHTATVTSAGIKQEIDDAAGDCFLIENSVNSNFNLTSNNSNKNNNNNASGNNLSSSSGSNYSVLFNNNQQKSSLLPAKILPTNSYYNVYNNEIVNAIKEHQQQQQQEAAAAAASVSATSSSVISDLLESRVSSRFGDSQLEGGVEVFDEKTQSFRRISPQNPNGYSNALGRLKSETIADDDFLEEMRHSWLHFRPQTPDLDQTLCGDDLWGAVEQQRLGLTESTAVQVELQTISDHLPADIFAPDKEDSDVEETAGSSSVFVTKPFALDHLVDDPHVTSPSPFASNFNNKSASNANQTLDNSSSGSEYNMSGSDELGLSLNESNDEMNDDHLFENILEECQAEELKTSNFWNGILDDNLLDDLDVSTAIGAATAGGAGAPNVGETTPKSKRNLFDSKIGYCCDLVGLESYRKRASSKNKHKRRRLLKRCNYRTGSTLVVLSDPTKDEFFKKSDDKTKSKHPPQSDASPTVEVKSELLDDSQIKNEPFDCELMSPSVVVLPAGQSSASAATVLPDVIVVKNEQLPPASILANQQIKVEPTTFNATLSHDYALPQPAQGNIQYSLVPQTQQQTQQQFIQQTASGVQTIQAAQLGSLAGTSISINSHGSSNTNGGNRLQTLPLDCNTIVLTTNAGQVKKQMNGPGDKAVVQNFYKIVNQKAGAPDPDGKRVKEINLLKKSFPELNLVSSSSNLILTASPINSNHNQQTHQYSFVQSMANAQQQGQQMNAQQPAQQTNKILITSSPSQSSTSNIAIAVPIQEILGTSHNKIQILSATPNNQQQPQQTASAAVQQQLHNAQRLKIEKSLSLSDTDKSRIFYNIKQARGTQILTTHLHPATKVVSILPIHANVNKSVQPQSGTTQQQQQQQNQQVLQHALKQQGMQKYAAMKHHQQQLQIQQQQQQQQQPQTTQQQSNSNTSDTQQQQSQQPNSIKIIQSTNDKPVTRINVNTTNR